MLYLIRHGETALNSAEGERMRGWLPVPLTSLGMQQAEDTGKIMSQIPGLQGKPVWTGDLPRTVQTAHEIATQLGSTIQPRQELRDWNTGDLAGTPVKMSLPTVFQHMDNPGWALPGGESFRDYYQRTVPFVKRLIEDKNPHVAVSHNRTLTLIHALAGSQGKSMDMNILKGKGPVDPAGFMVLQPDWSISYSTPRTDIPDPGARRA